ncbi:hypothetical protein V1520DRAFT_328598 [Lipomyces starkeyi]
MSCPNSDVKLRRPWGPYRLLLLTALRSINYYGGQTEHTPRSPTSRTYCSILEDDSLLPSTRTATSDFRLVLSLHADAKSEQHRLRKRLSLGVFDILKRDCSNLIDRDCLGKLHTAFFHRIKEIVERMSEEEKEALKASEADPETAMSNLYTSISADIVTGSNSYFTLKDSVIVFILAPTATNGPQPTKSPKLSAVKEKAMREAFKKLLAQATDAEHADPLQFRSLKTLESELAGRGFRLQFEGDWTWTTFESAYKSKSTTAEMKNEELALLSPDYNGHIVVRSQAVVSGPLIPIGDDDLARSV